MPKAESRITKWDPTEHLALRRPCALLIINQPITDGELFRRLWRHSTFRICADGGANRLFDFSFTRNTDTRTRNNSSSESSSSSNISDAMEGEYMIPDEICGDLDSIRKDVREEYTKRGVTITHLPSQYETDFGKCVGRIGAYYDDNSNNNYKKASTSSFTHGDGFLSDFSSNSGGGGTDDDDTTFDILVLGGLGGRVDQAFSIVQHLFYNAPEKPTWAHGSILLFSEENVSFVLRPGRNDIVALRERRSYLGRNVGILPVGRPAVLSTKGLEWDVSGWRTEFGKQVSTSNHLAAGEEGDVVVQVSTDESVLFTLERAAAFPDCVCCP